jgi:hypothetical protein
LLGNAKELAAMAFDEVRIDYPTLYEVKFVQRGLSKAMAANSFTFQARYKLDG